MSHNIFVKAFVEMRTKNYNPDGTPKNTCPSTKASDSQNSQNTNKAN